jgi:hypothetical protein
MFLRQMICTCGHYPMLSIIDNHKKIISVHFINLYEDEHESIISMSFLLLQGRHSHALHQYSKYHVT